MKKNPLSSVVKKQLEALGLAQIPPAAVAVIEVNMLEALTKLAAHKMTTRFVSKAILKAASNVNKSSYSNNNVDKFISPKA